MASAMYSGVGGGVPPGSNLVNSMVGTPYGSSPPGSSLVDSMYSGVGEGVPPGSQLVQDSRLSFGVPPGSRNLVFELATIPFNGPISPFWNLRVRSEPKLGDGAIVATVYVENVGSRPIKWDSAKVRISSDAIGVRTLYLGNKEGLPIPPHYKRGMSFVVPVFKGQKYAFSFTIFRSLWKLGTSFSGALPK